MLATIPAPRTAATGSRPRLLTGCAIAVALVAVTQAPSARAQVSPDKSFQGTGSIALGSASINQSGTQDTITVNSSQAVIDWRLDNEGGTGPINFLPEGRTGLFTSGEVSNFVVLNRIVPTDQTRGIRLDGTVRSQIRSPAGAPVTGGSVWFYSPGGIIAGANSLFDVGSLLLTTNDIDTTGGLFGRGGEIRFRGAEGSQSAVQIDAGARIRALATNSYVALVAPRIVQNGNVQVDGSAAYIAAEAADVTINNGLFDIRFVTGTTAENAITHGGTTTGPASTGTTDNHRIYMAAVAKNDAVSMLLGGTIGYEPAASATVENGVVILSAGYGTVGGTGVDAASATGGDGNIEISTSAFLSLLGANASDSILVNPGGPAGAGRVRFDANATLTAVNSVVAATENANESISAFGNLTLRATGTGTGAQSAAISALGNETGYGGLFISGRLTVDASGLGLSAGQVPGPGGAGVGGTASVDVTGTRLSADSLYVLADGLGGTGTDAGGNGRGGSASVSLINGDIAVNREVYISAAGRGGAGATTGGVGVGGSTTLALSGDSMFNANLRGTVQGVALLLDSSGLGGGDFFGVMPVTGGAATGGVATVSVDGGLLLVPGSVQVDAGAIGGRGSSVAGAATGGSIDVTIDGGDATINRLTLSTNAESLGNSGGEPSTEGSTAGGDVTLSVSNGTLTSSLGISIGATADSYSATGLGAATGGTIGVDVGPGGDLFTEAGLSLRADAYASSFAGLGRSATGGDIAITLGGGQIGTAELIASASAFAGSGAGAGGVGTGGSVTIEAGGGASLIVSTRTQIDAGGTGGSGLNRDPGGLPAARPGAGNGGTVRIATEGSAIALGETARIDASGDAGNAQAEGVAGPGAFGGLVDIDLNGGSLSFGSLDIMADGGSPYSGEGGFSNGNGGVGNGGTVTIGTFGASIIGTSLGVSAQGYGGPAFDDYVGGTGTGGTISVTTGGEVDLDTISLTADGTGGTAENGATGGVGRGGSVLFDVLGGRFDSSFVGLSAAGYGGSGGDAFEADAGDGGDGFGGTTRFTIGSGALADIGELTVRAMGFGGVGGDVGYFDSGYGDDYGFADQNGGGGNGSGGIVTINIAGGTDATDLISIGSLTASTAATGGAGGTFIDFSSDLTESPGGFSPFALGGPGSGGDATGGSTSVTIAYDGIELGTTVVDASAVAGDGAIGIEGGAGGSAVGGTALFDAVHTELALANLQVLATATAGTGADSLGFGGAGGDGGNATGGTATIRAQTVDTRLTLGIVTLSTDAVAGAAGDGSVAATGGNGGVGGIAIGGTSAVSVEDAVLVFDNSPFGDPLPRYTITARATGGAGGIGADGTDFGDTGGFGGAGGAATGGTARISVAGGSVTGPGLTLNANAIAGLGGLGGTGATFAGVPGEVPPILGVTKLQALSGTGTGGTAALSVGDNAGFGSMTFGATTLTATGTGAGGAQPGASIGGLISIRDTATNPAGSLLLASLDAQAGPFGGGGFQLYSADGPVRVTGDATIDVGGQIRIEGSGAGGLAVGGALNMFTNADIAVTQADPLGTGDPFVTIQAGSITAESFTGFIAGPGSRIVSTGSTSINAHSGALLFDTIIAGGAISALGGNIDGTTAQAGGNAFFSALGDVALRTVTTTGETGYGNITVNANGSASVGTLDAFGRVTVDVLGNLVGLPDPNAPDIVGAVLVASTDIDVTTGVDAQILSADAGDEIDLVIGGSLEFGTLNAVRSIETASGDGTVGDSVTAGTSAFLQSGLAGLRLGSVITGTSAALNSTGAVSFGAGRAGGDFGAQGASVTASIVTTTGATGAPGNIVLIATGGGVEVDQADAFGSVALQAAGNVGAGTLDASANVLLVFGGDATVDSATAAGVFLAQGGGALTFTTIDAGLQTSIELVGGLNGGTILSGGVTDIDAGDVILTTLSSDGLATVTGGGIVQIDSIVTPLGGSFTAGGDLTVGGLQSGGLLSLNGFNVTVLSDITDADELAITTQNDLTLQNVTLAGDFDVVVPGAIDAGTITSGGDILISASQIDLAGAFARYSVNLSASSTVAVGAGSAGDDFLIDAGGDVTLGAITATGAETGYGGEGGVGSNIDIFTLGTVRARSLDAFDRLTVSAATLTGNPPLEGRGEGGAVLAAGDDIAITTTGSALIASADAGLSITIASDDLEFGTLDAGTSIAFTATGNIAGDAATAGTGITIGTPEDVTIDSIVAGGAVSLAAGSFDLGSLTANSLLVSGGGGAIDLARTVGDVTILTEANVTLGDIASSAGAIDVTAGNIGGGALVAATSLSLDGNAITLGTIRSGGATEIIADGLIDLTSAQSGTGFTARSLGGAIDVDTLTTGGFARVTTDLRAIRVGQINTPVGGTFTAAADLTVGGLNSGGLLTLNGFNVTVLSDITDANFLSITTQNNLTLQDVTLAGDFDVTVPGALTAGIVTSGGDIIVDAGAIDLAGAFARYSVDLTAITTVSVGNGRAGDDFLVDAGGAVSLGSIVTTGAESGYGGEGGPTGSNIIVTAGDGVIAGRLQAFDDISIEAAGGLTGLPVPTRRGEGGAVLVSGGDIELTTGGDALIASANAGDEIDFDIGGGLEFGTLVAGRSIESASAGATAGDIARSGTSAVFNAGAAGLTLDSLTAGNSAALNSAGTVTLGTATVGGDFGVNAGDAVLGSITTTGTVRTRPGNIVLVATGDLSIDNADAFGSIGIQTGGTLTANTLEAGAGIALVPAGDATLGSARAGTAVVAQGTGALDFGTIEAGTSIEMVVGGLIGDSITAGTTLAVTADDIVDIATLAAGGQATVTGGSDVSIGSIETAAGGSFTAAGDLTVGALSSGGLLSLDGFNVTVLSNITDAQDLSITTDNNLTLQNVTLSGDFGVTVPGALTAGTITSGGGIFVDAGAIDLAGAFARYSVDLTASDGISVGSGSAGDDFLVDAGGDVFLGGIVTTGAESGYGGEGGFGSNIIVNAGADIVAGSLNAFDTISVTGDGSLIGVPAPEARGEGGSVLVAGGDIEVTTGGNQLIASADAGGSIRIGADALEFGAFTAVNGVTIGAAGDVAGDAIDVSRGSIGIDADGGVTVDELTASGSIGVSAGAIGTGVTIGTLQAGNTASLTSLAGVRLDDGRSAGNFSIQAEGDVVLGAVVTTGSEFGYGATIGVTTGGSLTAASLDSAGQIAIDGDGGILVGSLAAADFARVTGGAGVTVNSIETPVGGSFSAVGDLTVGALASGGLLTLDGFNVTVLSDITDADALAITTQNNLTLQDVTLTGDFDVTVPGALTAGIVTSGGDIIVDAGAIDLAGAFARYSVDLTSLTTISVGNGRAGDDFLVDAGGAVSLGSIVTTGAESGYGGEGGPTGSNIIVTAGDGVVAGRLQAFDDISIEADGGLTGLPVPTRRGEGGAVLVSGGDIELTTGGDALIASANAGDEIDFDIGGGLEFGTLVAGRSIESASGGATAGDLARSGTSSVFNAGAAGLTLDSLTAGTSAALNSTGTVTLGTATVGGDFGVTAGDAVLGSITTTGAARNLPGNIVLIATGNLGIDTAGAFGSIGIQTGGTLNAATLEAGGSIVLIPTGDVTLGTARAGTAFVAQGTGALDFGSIEAGTSIEMLVGGLTGDSITAGTTLAITADDIIDIATLTAGGQATVSGGSDVRIGSIATAAGGSFIAAGDLTVGALSSGGLLTLDGFNVTVLSDITDAQDLAITTGNNLTLQNVTLSGDFGVAVPGALTAGTITSGGDIIVDAGAIDLAGAFARYSVDLTATTTVIVDAGRAGDDFLVDAGGDVSLGSIVTTGAESGYGGEGGNDGSNIFVSAGGDVFAGSLTAFDAIGIDAGGDLTGFAGTGGTGGNGGGIGEDALREGGAVLVAGGSIGVTTGGSATILGAEAGFDIDILTGSFVDFGTLDAGGDVRIASQGVDGGSVTAGDDVDILSGLAVAIGTVSAGDEARASAGAQGLLIGTISAGSNVSITSLGAAAITDGTAGDGDFTVDADGDVTLGTILALGESGYGGEGGAGNILIGSGGLVTVGSATAFGAIDIDADGDISGTSFVAGDMLTANGRGSFTAQSVRVTGATGSGNTAIDAATGIDIRTLAAAGNAAFTAANGDIAVTDDIAVNGIVTALGRTVLLNALGGLRVGSATATAGAIDIDAGGALTIDAGSATGGIALASTGGSATAGTLTTIAGDGAGDIAITAADDVLLNGAVTARGALAVDAGDLIRVSALADGTSVTLGSNDIEIGAQGRVGTIGKTTLVDITNTGARRTFIGGSGGNAGFDVSAAEIARIFSDDIFIHAPPVAAQGGQSVGSSRTPDVIVGAFTLTSRAGTQGGNLGSGGTFGIDTTGKLRVVGDALFTGLGADNRVELVADDALEVDSRTGSILLNGGGGLAGTLILTSDDIFVGTLEALGDIAAAPDMAAIDERLGRNDGVLDEGGAIQAGGLEVNAGNGFFVQNSGVESRILADRRGFTVGTGGLTIRTGGGDTRIVINGREVDPVTSGFFTGLDLIPRVRILGADGDLPGAFDQGSTINGCLIANTAACQIVVTFPVQDVIQDITDPSQVTVQPLQSPLIELRDFERFGFQPLIDEPVTGAGNDDLWTEQCRADPRQPNCPRSNP